MFCWRHVLSAYLHNLFWLFSSRYFSWTNLIRWSYQNCGWADSQVPDHYWRECPWGQNKIGRIHCVQGEPLSSGCEAVTNLSVSKVTGGKSRRLPWHQELTPYASSLRMKARSATPQAGDIILYVFCLGPGSESGWSVAHHLFAHRAITVNDGDIYIVVCGEKSFEWLTFQGMCLMVITKPTLTGNMPQVLVMHRFIVILVLLWTCCGCWQLEKPLKGPKRQKAFCGFADDLVDYTLYTV